MNILACFNFVIDCKTVRTFAYSRKREQSCETLKGHSLLRFESIKREDGGEYWCEGSNFAGWEVGRSEHVSRVVYETSK